MKFLTLVFISTAFAFGSTANQEPNSSQQQPQTGAGYRLAPNDLIHISVYQENDLESKIRIARDGSITLPLLGNVKVAHKTVEQASAHIKSLLEKDFLVNPQVTVNLLEQAPRRFTVLGQVQRPGTYKIPEGEYVNLLQAIGIAGGYTRIANPSKITIKRQRSGKDQVIEVNAKEMARDQNTTSLEVLPSDVITVNESIF
jgi:protein involved in polysaccharide export with SLBB domain